MRGPPPKPSERRQRRNRRVSLVLGQGGLARPDIAPPPPAAQDHWLEEIKVQWAEFWGSELAAAAKVPTDLPGLVRLFSLRDERERAYRSYRKKRLVLGSQGQMVINPMAKVVQVCDAEIRMLEDRFGLSSQARARLGITFMDAKAKAHSLESMNQDLASDGGRKAEGDARLALEKGGKRR